MCLQSCRMHSSSGFSRENEIRKSRRALALEQVVNHRAAQIEIGEQDRRFQLRLREREVHGRESLAFGRAMRWSPRSNADPAGSADGSAACAGCGTPRPALRADARDRSDGFPERDERECSCSCARKLRQSTSSCFGSARVRPFVRLGRRGNFDRRRLFRNAGFIGHDERNGSASPSARPDRQSSSRSCSALRSAS